VILLVFATDRDSLLTAADTAAELITAT